VRVAGTVTAGAGAAVLLFRAASRHCAFPVERVIETMRPLPYQTAAHGPDCILGVALVRGTPLPVVDLGRLLDGNRLGQPGSARWISVRAGARVVVVAVEAVLGVTTVTPAALGSLPPLLRDSAAAGVRAVGELDGELLTVLETGRLVPEDVAL
jgi:purine-binding chemotaxis protein CheW